MQRLVGLIVRSCYKSDNSKIKCGYCMTDQVPGHQTVVLAEAGRADYEKLLKKETVIITKCGYCMTDQAPGHQAVVLAEAGRADYVKLLQD